MRQRLRAHLSFANVVSLIALSVALGGTTLAATGGNFILGQPNSAGSTTSLSSGTTGPALKVTSTNAGTGATALGLNVPTGHAPLTVNSGAKVTNLNADKVDGKHTSNWKAKDVINSDGPLPVEGTYTSSGGNLLIMASGSGFRSSGNTLYWGNIGMDVRVDGYIGRSFIYANERDSHKAFVPNYLEVPGLAAGSHTIRLEAVYQAGLCNTGSETTQNFCTTTDSNDFFDVAVIEVPS